VKEKGIETKKEEKRRRKIFCERIPVINLQKRNNESQKGRKSKFLHIMEGERGEWLG
jgi:hypothetical protein